MGNISEPEDPAAAPGPDLTHAWSPQDVAEYLGCSRRKVMELIGQDGFPCPRRLGARTYRWAPEVIVEWLAAAVDRRPRRAEVPRGRHTVERV